MITQKGILIGPKQKNRVIVQSLGIANSLRSHYSEDNDFNGDINKLDKWIYPFRAIVLRGQLYQLGDTVVVKSNSLSLIHPLKAIIKSFFVHEVE